MVVCGACWFVGWSRNLISAFVQVRFQNGLLLFGIRTLKWSHQCLFGLDVKCVCNNRGLGCPVHMNYLKNRQNPSVIGPITKYHLLR